jgi:hypothetical protein
MRPGNPVFAMHGPDAQPSQVIDHPRGGDIQGAGFMVVNIDCQDDGYHSARLQANR